MSKKQVSKTPGFFPDVLAPDIRGGKQGRAGINGGPLRPNIRRTFAEYSPELCGRLAKIQGKGWSAMTFLQAILTGVALLAVLGLGFGWIALCDRLGW